MGGRELAESHCIFPSEGIVVRSAHLTQLWPGFIHGRPPRRHRNYRRHSGGAPSHSYQVVARKTIQKKDLRLTLGHVTSSAQLARIDPDTGLQFNLGPSRLRFMTVAVRRNSRYGSLLATFSKADAKDIGSGEPRSATNLIDLLGTIQKLSYRLQARGEFEYVGTKPLATGCLANLDAECRGTSVKSSAALWFALL